MKDLTQGNIYKTFFLFAIPIVLSGLLTMTYNLVDTMIAGKFLGEAGLAAVGASGGFMDFFSSIFWGYTNGYCIYLARLFGAGKYRHLKTAASNFFVLTAGIGLIASAVVITLRYPILRLLNTDPTVIDDAATYFAIFVSGRVFFILSYNSVCTLHAIGISSFPFYVSLMSGLLNVVGNIISVTWLHAGVAGLALASVVSSAVGTVLYLLKLSRCFAQMGVSQHRVEWGLTDARVALRYAVPTMAQQVSMYTASLLISPIINGISAAATAGYSVANKIYTLNANIYQNSAKTISNYVAQSIGAGKPENLRRGIRVGALQGALLLAPALILCVVFAEPVCMLFFRSSNDLALQYAVTFTRYFLPFIYINLINNLLHAFYRGVACMDLLLYCTVFGAVVHIASTALLVPIYGINGVYIGWVISWILEAVLNVILYVTGAWKRSLRGILS